MPVCLSREIEAENAYRTAIEAGVGMAWNNLGLPCQRRGRWLEAEAAYREALAADITAAWMNLGNLLLWQPDEKPTRGPSRTLARSRVALRLRSFVRVVERER